MEDGLLGAIPDPDDELGAELFGPERAFADGPALSPTAGPAELDELPVLADAYLGAVEPAEPLLRAFIPPPGAEEPAALLGDFAELTELRGHDDAAPAYSVHVLSSLLPLGAGVRVIPVEIKEADGTVSGSNPEEAAFQNPLAQESYCKFPSSQEAQEASSCSWKKDSSPMVICQLKGGTQMLCIDNCGTKELKALHLVPQYDDQSNFPQSDVPKSMTTLVGTFLPVPAKLNLYTQVDNGALQSAVGGPALTLGSGLQGPPKVALAGYCDCFTGGDFYNSCKCNNCCNNLRQETERFRAIKVRLDRNPEAFQPQTGKGQRGDVKLRYNKGCSCKRSGCLKNYCECYEAKIMCSSMCKCVGCKNYEESPERKTLRSMPHYMEAGDIEGSQHLSPVQLSGYPKLRKDGQPSSCISWEVVEATCSCLLAQGEVAEQECCPPCLAEQLILEEFGRCLSQILHVEFKSKGLKIE
ncbi:tesmin [Nannospalax galili]|uniref:Testis expressed metallothionein like n=1 Tax=Nannospalax galili TaxID=1026970 RepID=A0A8C6RW23_NANGA|nr:tesmin [Nannospalax galili]